MNYKKTIIYAVLIATAVVSLFPLFWLVITAFAPASEITSVNNMFPKKFTYENFQKLFKTKNLFIWLLNSAIVSVVVTVFHLFFDSLSGYAFAKKEFPGKNIIFWLILSTMMVPGQVILVPLFVMMIKYKLIDTLWAIILPGLAGPFGIFMMKQYIQTIPKEYEDSARIDGCSELGIYFRIIVPLCKPAFAALAIFVFVAYWNGFIWPLIALMSEDKYVLPVGLATLQEQQSTDYGLLMAGAAFAALPMIAVFFVFQKYFMAGLRIGGMKD